VLVGTGAGGTYLLIRHSRPTPASPPAAQAPGAQEKTAAVAALTVNELAARPGDHLGSLQLVGVVAAAEPGTRFVLIDRSEYQACGLGCLTEAGTRKITVRWTGEAPPVERAVRVAGKLARTAQGFTFTATGVDAL
jgi:hypothetical protein